MSQVTRAASKLKFETGDVPTQGDYTDLHDSVVWYDEKTVGQYRKIIADADTILSTDYVLSVNNGVAQWSITLPDPTSMNGRIYLIKRFDDTSTNLIIIDAAAGLVQHTDGTFGSSTSISALFGLVGSVRKFISNGTNWESIQ